MSKHLIFANKVNLYNVIILFIIAIEFPYDKRLWVIVTQVNLSSQCWQNEYFYMLLKPPRLPGVLYLKEEDCISQEKNPVKFYVLYIDSLSS